VAPYETKELLRVVEEVCQPERQLALRTRAANQAPLFSANGVASWLWESVERGEPCDERYEQAFCRTDNEIVPYIESPTPKDLLGDFVSVYHGLRRLERQGFSPDFVVDVGASSGVWSDVAKRVFPKSRFILIDPLHAYYRRMNDWFFRIHPEFECISAAVSDRRGETELNVSPDLYGSSLFHPQDFRKYDSLKVPTVTLDQVASERQIVGRGLLKIDVQFAEHLVLKGAEKFIAQVDVLLVELSLVGYASQAMLFPEMCQLIRGLGFRYYDETGGWRSPADGTLLQKDVLFVREHLFVYPVGGKGKSLNIDGNGSVSKEVGTSSLGQSQANLQPAAADF
jgi:FkbM family methyltransferase